MESSLWILVVSGDQSRVKKKSEYCSCKRAGLFYQINLTDFKGDDLGSQLVFAAKWPKIRYDGLKN